MLQSEVQAAARAAHLDDLGQAALQALTAGATRDEVMTTLSAVIDDYQARQLPMLDMLPRDDSPIYSETPDGLIDLPSAAKELGVATAQIRVWLAKGYITSYGRLKAPAPGGGFHSLKMDEITAYREGPRNKGGRPKTT